VSRRDDFLIGPKEKAIEAIKSGKAEEALRYLNEAYDMFRDMHDGYVNGYSLMQGLLAEVHGEEWLEEFNRKRVFQTYEPSFRAMKNMSPEQRVDTLCGLERTMYTEFHVEEDKERFVLVITGCNNGGRLIRDGIAKQQNAVTKKAYPWSFDRVGFPYYCVHAYFFKELFKELGIRIEIQWGRQYDDQGKPVDEPCKYIIYK
jgi:hypothetical protein